MSIADGWPNRRRPIAMLLLGGLLVPVAVESHAVTARVDRSIVFALDLSNSVLEPEKAVRDIADTVWNHRPGDGDDSQRLAVFGKSSLVDVSSLQDLPIESVASQIEHAPVSLEQILSASAAMIPPEKQGRVVLISDGTKSVERLSDCISDLKSRDVPVDVLPIDYAFDREVWMERLNVSSQVKPGEAVDATVSLSSLADGRGMLRLYENGMAIAERTIEYKAGSNSFSFPITLRGPGEYEFAATIEVAAGEDHVAQNNSVQSIYVIDGGRKVLLVVDDAERDQELMSLESALRHGENAVDIRHGNELPIDPSAFGQYDSIIFHKVARHRLSSAQLVAVRDAVHAFGVGFLMIGSRNSFGPGGYYRSAIEEVLPVTMDPAHRNGGLVFVLQRFRSPESSTLTKRMIKLAIRELGTNDQVGVLAPTRYGGDRWLGELRSASKFEEVNARISAAEILDPPDFRNLLEMGLIGLTTSATAARHMIVLTDGTPKPPEPELIRKFADHKIRVSVLMFDSDRRVENWRTVAESTGGRFHHPDSFRTASDNLIDDVRLLRREAPVTTTTTPAVAASSSKNWKLDDIPTVNTFAVTGIKERTGAPVLNVSPISGKTNEFVPIFAMGEFGRGRTAAFTSDFDSNWQSWAGFQPFVNRVINEISRINRDVPWRLSIRTEDGNAIILLQDVRSTDGNLRFEVTLYGPDGTTRKTAFESADPGYYKARVPLWGHGHYHAIAQTSDRRNRIDAALFVPPFEGDTTFRSNRQLLTEIAAGTGGRVLTGDPAADAIYTYHRSTRHTSYPSIDGFLIMLALLVPVYWQIRRFDWKKSWNALIHPRSAPPTPTFVALLQTKRWVSEALGSKGKGRLLIQLWSPAPRAVSSGPNFTADSATSTPTAPLSDADSTATTIEKLLALKRQQEQSQ